MFVIIEVKHLEKIKLPKHWAITVKVGQLLNTAMLV